MSVSTTYPFTEASNYSFDNTKVQVSGGQAELKLVINGNQLFNQDFSSSAGFTFDATKAEFIGGVVAQKIRALLTNELMFATIKDGADADLFTSSGTATAVGGAGLATLSGNQYLDLSDATAGKYWEYPSTNANFTQTGTIRFKVVPNYSGGPSANRYFFVLTDTSLANKNTIWLIHQANQNIQFRIYDSGGILKVSKDVGTWTPVSGTEYELELNIDLTGGANRLFIDGTQLGTTATTTGTRTNTIDQFAIGPNVGGNRAEMYVRDIQVFDAVQHTSNYVIGGLTEKLYLSNNVDLPDFAHIGAGDIQSYDGLTTVEVNAPRYTVKTDSGTFKYYNGSAWVTSDGTYAQANTASQMNTNLPTLSDALNGLTATARIHFTGDNVLSSVSDLTLEHTGRTYLSTNDTVTVNSGINMEGLVSIVESATKSGTDEIKYILCKNGSPVYHDGLDWVASDGTYAQSNTAAEINAVASTYTTVGVTVLSVIFLHAGDGVTTPQLDSLTLTYDFFGGVATAPFTVVVFGTVFDETGAAVEGATISAVPTISKPVYESSAIISIDQVTTTSSVTGYWELELIRSVDMDANWNITISHENRSRTFDDVVVPDRSGVALEELV